MKQKDITLIVVLAFISAVVSLIISSQVFVTPANRQQKVQVVDSINDQFVKPSEKYFNSQSINPAQQIQIGDNTNTNPFNGSANQ